MVIVRTTMMQKIIMIINTLRFFTSRCTACIAGSFDIIASMCAKKAAEQQRECERDNCLLNRIHTHQQNPLLCRLLDAHRVQRKRCPIARGQWNLLLCYWILLLTCPMSKWSFLRNLNNRRTVRSILLFQKLLGLVEIMPGLVNVGFSLPKWQAVKMIFFAPCAQQLSYRGTL